MANETEIRSDKLELEIVTPKGKALSVIVDEVTAPSVDGEFGVMPGHLPLLAALRIGLVSYRQGGETKRGALRRGFAEAGPHKVAILTDDYVEREQVDPVRVRKELGEVQVELNALEQKPADDADEDASGKRDALVNQENWLAALLELYGDPPPATMRPFERWGPPDGPSEDEVPMPNDDHAAPPAAGS